MPDQPDLRLYTRIAFINQGETVSGRNTNAAIAEAAGVATVTTAQAHNYNVGDRIFISGVTGAGAAVYNSGTGFLILTVPSTTTFTISVPSGTGASAGTPVVDKPIECNGYLLNGVQVDATPTNTTMTFGVLAQPNSVYAQNTTTWPVLSDNAGAAISFTNLATAKFLTLDTKPTVFQGIAFFRAISGGAEGAARRYTFSFVRMQA